MLADERFVDDRDAAAAPAVSRVEVPTAARRCAHRFEPAWCRRVQPGLAADHRSVADADLVAQPAATGEELLRGDRCRTNPGDRRRCVPQARDTRTALI